MKNQTNQSETGKIISFYSGIARVEGLSEVFEHEVISDEKGDPIGVVIGFDNNGVDILTFNDQLNLKSKFFRTNKLFSIKISENIIGRVINPLGKALDQYADLTGMETSVFAEAPQIIDRKPVTIPLSTGVKIIDTTLPLGRGQRELIIGDRKIGKSTLAEDIVLNQKHDKKPVICVYVLIGQKKQKLLELMDLFERENAYLYSIIVAATSASSLAEIYLAPFVGCAIGEFFRTKGGHSLVIYDDFSKHAKAYRDIALLTKRPPGREAYPGDIFSLHAKILERAGALSDEKGGGTLSALPIIETEENDITAFIPTNLISITDGQIYFERGLYQKGFLPAINVGLSVSRVGSAAQPKPLKEVTGGLRLALSQHKELQKLVQLDTTQSKESQDKIKRGELLLELLKQDKHTNLTWEEQVILFHVVEKGSFDDLSKEKWHSFKDLFSELLQNRYFDILEDVNKTGMTKKTEEKIETVVSDFKKDFYQ